MSNKIIKIHHSNQNGTEYGYGLYINAVVGNTIHASECIAKTAGADEIKHAEKLVYNRTRAALIREFGNNWKTVLAPMED